MTPPPLDGWEPHWVHDSITRTLTTVALLLGIVLMLVALILVFRVYGTLQALGSMFE